MNAPLPPPPDELLVEHAPPRATWRWWEAVIVTLLGFVLGTLVSVPVFLALGGASGQRMNGPGAADYPWNVPPGWKVTWPDPPSPQAERIQQVLGIATAACSTIASGRATIRRGEAYSKR